MSVRGFTLTAVPQWPENSPGSIYKAFDEPKYLSINILSLLFRRMSSSCTSLSTSFLAWGLDCDELAPSCGIFLPGVYAGSSKVSALSVLTKLVLHTPILAYFFPDDNIGEICFRPAYLV